MQQQFNKLLQIIEKAKSFGYQENKNGSKLYGHVPHIAPFAWFHTTYKPLSFWKIRKLEKMMNKNIQDVYKQFLKMTNGIDIFSNTLSLYGYMGIINRSDFNDRNPYNLINPNTIERIDTAPDNWFFIGSYGPNADQLFIDTSTDKIYRCERWTTNIISSWPDFWTMLFSEAKRMSKLFTNDGHLINKNISI